MMNKLVEWLIEQNKAFGTNGFAATCDGLKLLCDKTGLTAEVYYFEDDEDDIIEIEDKNLLVVGSQNLIDLEITRPWLRFQLYADILPFGNMFNGRVNEIYSEISGHEHKLSNVNMLDEQREQEWAYNLTTHQEKYKGILTNPEDPAKHPFWYALTMDQKKIVAKYHQHIKATNIKVVPGIPRFKW